MNKNNSELIQGIIIKGIGGFYYVDTGDGRTYECRARGIFRKNDQTPLPGDRVMIRPLQEDKGSLDEILPRKNVLIRPPVANIDIMFIVVACADPEPNLKITDKLIAVCENKSIEPVILINKTDLKSGGEILALYKNAGFKVVEVSAATGKGIEEVVPLIRSNVCAFAGNSGVGKSSIINLISPDIKMEVGSISEKISRGKHTTRHVQLIRQDGGFIADTPGFGDISTDKFEMISKEQLFFCFREFKDYADCRFADCRHISEPQCGVLKAVAEGKISPSRHQSYVAMYDEVKDFKTWEH